MNFELISKTFLKLNANKEQHQSINHFTILLGCNWNINAMLQSMISREIAPDHARSMSPNLRNSRHTLAYFAGPASRPLTHTFQSQNKQAIEIIGNLVLYQNHNTNRQINDSAFLEHLNKSFFQGKHLQKTTVDKILQT